MNPETALQNAIRLAISPTGARLFRNSVGTAVTRTGATIRFGLCVGSSDLIGWTPRDGVAVFTAIEVKTATGRLSEEQEKFLAAVEKAGGIAGVARSQEEAIALLRRDAK